MSVEGNGSVGFDAAEMSCSNGNGTNGSKLETNGAKLSNSESGLETNGTSVLSNFEFVCDELLYLELENIFRPFYPETDKPAYIPSVKILDTNKFLMWLEYHENNSPTGLLLKDIVKQYTMVKANLLDKFQPSFQNPLYVSSTENRESKFSRLSAVFYGDCEQSYKSAFEYNPELEEFLSVRRHIAEYFLHLYRRIVYIRKYAEYYIFLAKINFAFDTSDSFVDKHKQLLHGLKVAKELICKIESMSTENLAKLLKLFTESVILLLNTFQSLILIFLKLCIYPNKYDIQTFRTLNYELFFTANELYSKCSVFKLHAGNIYYDKQNFSCISAIIFQITVISILLANFATDYQLQLQ